MQPKILALLLGVGVAAVALVGGWALNWLPSLPGTSPTQTAQTLPAPAEPASVSAQSKPMAPAAVASAAALARVAPAEPQRAVTPTAPQFDVVRVERNGEAVVAGRAAPDSKVALTSGGKVLAEATADAAGNFVMVPQALAPGDYALGLKTNGAAQPSQSSTQSVTVSVPEKGKSGVMVALAEPGKPTRVLTDPTETAKAPPAPTAISNGKVTASSSPPIAFKTAEVEGGGFFAAGTAAPGARLRLYLNGSTLTDVTAGADGQWSVKVGKGVTPGQYSVRADAVDTAGKVVARAEVPFNVPVSMAAAKPVPTEVAAAAPPNQALVREIQTATVVRGDNLWAISRKILGQGMRYTQIYAANTTQIRDPKLIYPGQVFVLPRTD